MPSRVHDVVVKRFITSPWIVKLLVFIVVVQLVLELQTATVTPFIYFRF